MTLSLPEAVVYNHGTQSMSATRPGVRARRGNYAARDPEQPIDTPASSRRGVCHATKDQTCNHTDLIPRKEAFYISTHPRHPASHCRQEYG